MQDHRQIVTLRQPQLRFQQRLLAIELRIVAVKIEANLSEGHEFRMTLCKIAFQLR